MAKMIFLDGADDEFIQISRAYSLNRLFPSKHGEKWRVSAVYDGKHVSYLAACFETRELCVRHLKGMVVTLIDHSN